MKIQLNAEAISKVKDLTTQIASTNSEIKICLNAREKRRIWENASPNTRNAEVPLRSAILNTYHHAGTSGYGAESQTERDVLFDITEILIRARRDRLVAQLDDMGVVLTDLPDFGPAPAWPAQPEA